MTQSDMFPNGNRAVMDFLEDYQKDWIEAHGYGPDESLTQLDRILFWGDWLDAKKEKFG